MLSLGYGSLTQRSQLVALRTDDIEDQIGGISRITLRHSKADPFGMGRIALSSKWSVALVSEWPAWRGDEIEPLFCCMYQGKPINPGLRTTKVKLNVK